MGVADDGEFGKIALPVEPGRWHRRVEMDKDRLGKLFRIIERAVTIEKSLRADRHDLFPQEQRADGAELRPCAENDHDVGIVASAARVSTMAMATVSALAFFR